MLSSWWCPMHYSDLIMTTMASQITSLKIVYSLVYSDADQRKHQSFASLAFVRGIHRGPVNSPHKWPVTWKMFPFDVVIMGFFCHPSRCYTTPVAIRTATDHPAVLHGNRCFRGVSLSLFLRDRLIDSLTGANCLFWLLGTSSGLCCR